jgi:hypothetical protein
MITLINEFSYLNSQGYTLLLLIILLALSIFRKYRNVCLQLLSVMNILLAITGSIWMVNFVMESISLSNLPDDAIERYALLNRMSGPYWWAYWINAVGTMLIPQLFWLRKYRKRVWLSVIVALAFQSERLFVFLTSFLRDYLPSSWAMSYGYSFGYFAVYVALVILIYLLKERFKIAL